MLDVESYLNLNILVIFNLALTSLFIHFLAFFRIDGRRAGCHLLNIITDTTQDIVESPLVMRKKF